MGNLKPFPCFACGKCCQNIADKPQAIYLDRGDGICRHYNELSKMCKIYNERPIICRIKDFYNTYLTHIYSWEEFVELNLKGCHQLNEK